MKNKTFLVQPIVSETGGDNPVILRFILNEKFTRVDFGYAAPWIYEKGGWIHIAPYTYLRRQGSNENYSLLNTQNIPISPDRHDFETIEDWKVFSLYFQPIPIKDCIVDIIEEENPSSNDFNYYGISLDNVKQFEIDGEISLFS